MKSLLSSRWLQSLAATLLAAVAGLAICTGWRWLAEPAADAGSRQAEIQLLQGELAGLRTRIEGLTERISSLGEERSAQLVRARQAARIASRLAESAGGLNRLSANPEQWREDERRLARMREISSTAAQRAGELKQQSARLQWQRDGLEIAAGQSARRLRALENPEPPLMRHLRDGWQRGRGAILALAAAAALMVFLHGTVLGHKAHA